MVVQLQDPVERGRKMKDNTNFSYNRDVGKETKKLTIHKKICKTVCA